MSTWKVLGSDWKISLQYVIPDKGSAQQPHALERESVSLSTMDRTVRESTGRTPAGDAAAEDAAMGGSIIYLCIHQVSVSTRTFEPPPSPCTCMCMPQKKGQNESLLVRHVSDFKIWEKVTLW